MVATGHGNYSDLPSTYRVLSRFSELVTMTPLETPPAALDARETLKNQEKDLEKQRREIEQLKRELAVSNPQSSLLADKEESEEEEDEEMVEVSVVIVGDSCKPSQMVATGHGNYSDLPSTYRVLSRFSELVTMTPLETPPAALDARETLKNQEKDLE